MYLFKDDKKRPSYCNQVKPADLANYFSNPKQNSPIEMVNEVQAVEASMVSIYNDVAGQHQTAAEDGNIKLDVSSLRMS